MEAIETLWDVELALGDVAELAAVADALARAGVNIDSVCIASAQPPVRCHLLVADGRAAAAVLAAAGVAATTRSVIVCALQNRPGTLAAVSAALGDAGVAVDLLYQATERGLVIGAGDLAAVRGALLDSGRLLAAPVGAVSLS